MSLHEPNRVDKLITIFQFFNLGSLLYLNMLMTNRNGFSNITSQISETQEKILEKIEVLINFRKTEMLIDMIRIQRIC